MHPLAPILLSDAHAIAGAAIDCLVIGSGTSGVTTAIELADRGLKVAIIEAGPLVLTEHVGSGPFANREDIVPQIHELVRYGTVWTSEKELAAAKALGAKTNNNAWSLVGGRTVFWGGCTPRFRDEDFADWPYGADEMRGWYAKAERLIGVSGSETDNAAAPFVTHAAQDRLLARCADHGIPATHAPLCVDTRAVHGGRMSLGFDSSVSRLLRCPHFGRIEKGARLSLAAETEALQLVVDGGLVRAVKVRDKTGDTFAVPARHVVLAGGCMQSTRLAMASGLGDSDPMVGRYMGDHLFRQAVFELPEPLKEKSLYIFLPPTEKRPFHAQLQGMFQETWYSPLHATCWLDGDAGGRYMLFYCFGISKAEEAGRMVLCGDGRSMRDYCIVNDRSAGDSQTLAQMAVFTDDVAKALGGKVVRTEENAAGSALHEFGGLRMGREPSSSVTDPDGRFWRIDNLSCADAAIWPHQGSANSYLTITAVALRNASRLAAALGTERRAMAAQ
jgi:choline dehydrogenase-like flavoprotein